MLNDKQKGVARGMAGAVVVALGAYALALWLGGDIFARMNTLETRLRLVALSDLPLILLLGISIGSLARHRFFTPEDIDGSGLTKGSAHARQLQAILQNTLEQTVLAVLAHLGFALMVPAFWLVLLPTGGGLFLLGRILFWHGYGKGASARAFGFALTFYSSMLIVLVAAAFAILPAA